MNKAENLNITHKRQIEYEPMLADVLLLDDLEGGIWVDMLGFDGVYSVSNYGRVKREFRYDTKGRTLKAKILKRNYWINKKGFMTGAKITFGYEDIIYSKAASIIVAEAFFGEIPKDKCVVHKDKNIRNDALENLAILPYSESLKIDYKKGIKTDWGFGIVGNIGKGKIVQQIDEKGNVVNEFSSLGEIEQKLGYKKSVISDMCRNRWNNKPHYRAYGFRWRFKHSS